MVHNNYILYHSQRHTSSYCDKADMKVSEVHKLWGLHKEDTYLKHILYFRAVTSLYHKIIILAYKVNSNL